jgi:starch synthase (maltosyl-transferring)
VPRRKNASPVALLSPIVIRPLAPRTPSGSFPAKAAVEEVVPVAAEIVKDGHDVLGARVTLTAPSGRTVSAPLRPVGGDRWEGEVAVGTEVGLHHLGVEAWTDRFATWRRDVAKKAAAGQDLEIEFEVGARFVDDLVRWTDDTAAHARLAAAAEGLRRATCTAHVRLSAGLDDAVADVADAVVARWDHSEAAPLPLWVDRERGAFSAWYELFPRSYGGFRGVIGELDRIAAMGFDILYLPPIHPIGRVHRKGRNNTLTPAPDDVGSPWAIGSTEGGHDAIHPDLGTEADLVALIAAARERGLEVALDLALQCAPDHPWVAHHPEWFTQLPDGTIRYAENPPKKYQDIYPINFWPAAEADRAALWQACLDVVWHWVGLGVAVFRVDNPHTKPVAFWQWLIEEVRRSDPGVLFLAEAFTAPAMMAKLGEVGFTQSYSYFTWRGSRAELTGYVQELAGEPLVSTMRANFWPNTPDILEGVLRDGPLSAFALRYVLAATLVPNYGIYSGYELGENAPASPDNTEYLNSEKYQLVHRDFAQTPNLTTLISAVNEARRRHRAFRTLRGTVFHGSDNEAILAYSKYDRRSGDRVIVVVNLDPWRAQSATLDLDLDALGLAGERAFDVHDALSGETWTWFGARPWVNLDPAHHPAHVLAVHRR